MIYLAFLQNQNPADFFDASTLTIVIAAAVVFVILVTIVPMLLIFRRVFGSLKQNQTLLATGEPAQAKILKMWDTGATLNDNPQVGLLLEVHRLDHTPYQVETKCFVSRLKIPQIQPGATVAVKVNPQDAAQVAVQLA